MRGAARLLGRHFGRFRTSVAVLLGLTHWIASFTIAVRIAVGLSTPVPRQPAWPRHRTGWLLRARIRGGPSMVVVLDRSLLAPPAPVGCSHPKGEICLIHRLVRGRASGARHLP